MLKVTQTNVSSTKNKNSRCTHSTTWTILNIVFTNFQGRQVSIT